MSAETEAFTIQQFCQAHGISRALFYILKRQNRGPSLMRVGRRVLISVEAAREWRERMTNSTKAAGERSDRETQK
jgi:hypothetical protein